MPEHPTLPTKPHAHRQLKQHTSPDGGIGRRAGLKHQWSNPCRYDPGTGYPLNRKSLIFKDLRFFFWILLHICTTEILQIAEVLPGIACTFTGKRLSVPSFFRVSRAVSLCLCTWSLAGLSKTHNFESINRSSALWINTERNIRGIRCL